MSSAHCLSPQASGTAACKRRAAAADGHGAIATPLMLPVALPPPASRAPSPRPVIAAAARVKAIILHPAYRLPCPFSVVVAAAAAVGPHPHPPSSRRPPHHRPSPSLSAALPIDALSAIAARLGEGRSLAAFAATCRACKMAAYDERLWRRECERRFGPIMAQPPVGGRGAAIVGVGAGAGAGAGAAPCAPTPTATTPTTQPAAPFSWRRLYAFNAHAYDAVVAATREAERARAMSRLLGASAARRWMVGRAAFGAATAAAV